MIWVGQQNKDLDISLEGKKLKQRDSFVYLGGAACRDGSTETEIRRIQAGVSAWRKVEGVMGDRHISLKLEGKVISSCITTACLYGLETMAKMEKQLEKLQDCENNCVRIITGVKRISNQSREELKKVGVRVLRGSW